MPLGASHRANPCAPHISANQSQEMAKEGLSLAETLRPLGTRGEARRWTYEGARNRPIPYHLIPPTVLHNYSASSQRLQHPFLCLSLLVVVCRCVLDSWNEFT